MIIKEEKKKNKPKRKKTLSVPNLDFSEIVKHYTKKPIYSRSKIYF